MVSPMVEYRISEVAERSGFSPSTLRFYESVDLLPEPVRSQGGYRVYDDHDLDRLRFIGRAKQLGLPLEEIRELVGVWDDGACALVQDRLRQLVADKIEQVESRVSELSALSGDLRGALSALPQPSPDGPCGPDCGCVPRSADVVPGPVPVSLRTARPVDTPSDWTTAAVACTLTGTEQPARLEQWRELLVEAVRTPTTEGMSMMFPPDPELAGRLAELAAREQQSCSFLGFHLTLSVDALVLEVRAATDAQDMVRSLFGEAV
jgi:DNA-binding transcriptional MerR regulator